MFLMRVKAKRMGSHTHLLFFAGFGVMMVEERFSNLGCAGELVLRNEEWEEFKNIITRPAPVAPPFYHVEIIDEQ
jgi:hypothetical protein